MNYTCCNSRINIDNKKTNLNVHGNNNTFVIRNSEIVINVNGNNNHFVINSSNCGLTINGNNNKAEATSSTLSFGLNGNNNNVRSDADSRTQVRFDNGCNNRYPHTNQNRPQPSRNQRPSNRNNTRPQQQVYSNRNIPPPQPSNMFNNTYSYPQYQNEPMQQTYVMNNMNNNQNPYSFGTFGSWGNVNGFNPQNFLQQMGQSFNMMVNRPPRMFVPPRRRVFNFYEVTSDSQDSVQEQKGLSPEQMEVLPRSKHTGKAGSCIICQCDIEQNEEQTFLMCFHSFHWQCVSSWLVKNGKCPVCQFDLKEHLNGIQAMQQQ